MSFDFFVARGRDQLPTPGGGDFVADQRARIAHEQKQELERKQQELLEQISARNTPAERIRIWERRHGLTLPRDSNHPALRIVAAATGLALEQMHEEQRRRSAPAKTEAAVSGDAPTSDSV
ncbi:MAG TPA: hypothetical protein VGR92_15555 [Steroidobacteraceae bacterium]|nr:hypothetical protein [Steroidobacteraceae bacterium]